MAKAYKASDLVISRAGANAITELGAVKKPVILIPNQLMAAHQVDNAVRLAEAGAVELMREDLLTTVNLTETVKEIIESKGLQNKLVEELSKVYVPDSTSRLVDLIVKAARVSK
jgi:UDP-N-acetylglucosamine--N-acetylmuramyl-(pentapeptide) pyrophosphoryl-undecaprenol N-acetylglucosamine transferase